MSGLAIATIVLSVLTILGVVACLIFKVKIGGVSIFWIVGLFGALILLMINLKYSFDVVGSLIQNTAINPVKILVLFISMTIISIILDCLGFYKYLANKCVKYAKGSQMRLFLIFYIFTSFITLFTSNDIIILSIVPFLCYFCKAAKIDVKPYVFATFVAANTWSMIFIFGNPTNIYVASFANIQFVEYFLVMALPTVLCALTSLGLLLLIFKKALKVKIENIETETVVLNKPLIIANLTMLVGCIVLMSIASYINLEMWYISLGFAVVSVVLNFIICLINKHTTSYIKQALKRIPWNFIPFLLSMFIVNMCLQVNGISEWCANLLNKTNPLLTYGPLSFSFANVMNNIPMTAFFASMLAGSSNLFAIYATNIGSSICALLTPIGSLAGIMFLEILQENKVDFSFATFVKYGVVISIPTLIVGLASLLIVL